MASTKDPKFYTFDSIYVFLDTEVFVKNKYDWDNKIFNSLYERINNGSIEILTTDIVIKEVKAKIEKQLEENLLSLDRVKKNTNLIQILRPQKFVELQKIESHEVLLNDAIAHVDQIFDKLSATIIDLPSNGLEKLFDLYFSKKPPFGEKKKKHEFPDAASILALYTWAENNLTEVYVVSGDQDLKDACYSMRDRLNYFSDFTKVLEKALRCEWPQDSGVADDLRNMLESMDETLLKDINSELEMAKLSVNLGDGFLDAFYADCVTIDDLTIFDRHEEDDHILFDVELTHSIAYQAIAVFDDKFFPYADLEIETSGSLDLNAMLGIQLNYKNTPPTIEIRYLNYDNLRDVNVSVPLSY